MSINRVILGGNLTRDPEVRQANSGTTIVNAGLAVNERRPDGQGGYQEEVSFVDLTLFGKQADAFSKWMAKGKAVLIEGRLKQDRWQDQNGGNRSKLYVIVDRWHFQGGREDGGAGAVSGSAQQPAQARGAAPNSTQAERNAALADAQRQARANPQPQPQQDYFDSGEVPF